MEWRRIPHIFPSVWIGEAELIVVDTHDMAISAVKVGQDVMFFAFPDLNVRSNASGGPELWAGKLGEWVKVDSVNRSGKESNDELSTTLVFEAFPNSLTRTNVTASARACPKETLRINLSRVDAASDTDDSMMK